MPNLTEKDETIELVLKKVKLLTFTCIYSHEFITSTVIINCLHRTQIKEL